MEAATLKKKKDTISKGKLKKSIKNVLCRPDQVFWPELSEDEENRLETALKKHTIDIPTFKKPHWKDLKSIPKDQRPKPPKTKKVNGLLLGIRECSEAIQNGDCSAIVIEAKINPRLIVHPLIEMCTSKVIPMLCLSELRKITASSFGIATSCLGIKPNFLLDLRKEIVNIANNHPVPKQTNKLKPSTISIEKMDVDENVDTKEAVKLNNVPNFQFLYRTNKKTRVFVPNDIKNVSKQQTRKFIGQDFIEFSEKPKQNDSKAYMKMILKRISNNPDRVKKK